jgi:hypothetical protein
MPESTIRYQMPDICVQQGQYIIVQQSQSGEARVGRILLLTSISESELQKNTQD